MLKGQDTDSNGLQLQSLCTATVRTVSQNDTGCNNFTKNIGGPERLWALTNPNGQALSLCLIALLAPTRLGTALDGLAETNGLASSRLTLPTIPMRVSYWYSLRL